MSKSRLLTMGLLAALVASPAFAQTTTPAAPVNPADAAVSRDVNQQERIEQGLKSGQLSTGEAAKLENGEKRIDNAEAHAMKDGTESTQEQAHIQKMENAESTKIYDEKHNATTGNPNSASSERMQNDVQRNVNQETRIDNGVKNGSLTTGEAAKMEKGQARTDRKEAKAGRNGNVNAAEQRRIQKSENKQNGKVWHAKHNRRHTSEGAAPATTPAQ